MLKASFIIQFVILLGTPVAVALWLNRRWKLSWGLFLGGALAFVGSWIISNLLPLPGELGLLISSITQMGALYLVYRFQLKTANTEREALMVGVGMGGIELILIGIFAVLSFTQMLPLRNATDATLISLAAQADGVSEEEIEPSRVDELRELVNDYWDTPAYGPLVQGLQTIAFLPIQIALSILVLGALLHEHWRSLWGAMGLYFLAQLLPIYGGILGGPFLWFALSLLFCGVALWFIKRTWPTIQEQNKKALERHRQAEQRT